MFKQPTTPPITGNHELYTGDVPAIARYVRQEMGVHVLSNQRLQIYKDRPEYGGLDKRKNNKDGTNNSSLDFFYVAGVNDYESPRFK